jgi:hypothetical protein
MSPILSRSSASRLMVVVLDGLHGVDVGDAWVHIHAGVRILDELGTTVGLMMVVSRKKHLHVLCFAG